MKKFEGMLFCTDLDGTLYASDKTVSRQNLEAIEYFKSEGGLFTFITGRTPPTSTDMYNIIKPNAPYGCFNGAGIYDAPNDKFLWKMTLPTAAMELISAVEEQLSDMGIQLNTEDKVYFYKDNLAMQWFRDITGAPNIYSSYEAVQDSIIKIVFAHTEQKQLDKLITLLHSHKRAGEFDFVCSERTLYEVLPKGASKGNALSKMAELFGIDKSRTIAVGDYNNDVSMIKAAGVGFAVANAVDEAKAVADHITVSNDEHAIATIIDRLDKGLYLK